MENKDLFVELLQVSLGSKVVHDSWLMVHGCSAAEWCTVFEEAERQAVVGVVFCGMEQLKANGAKSMGGMPQALMLQWIGEVMQIEQRNAVTTKACQELCRQLEEDGFEVCVLKGQANHRYYPAEMANRRSCGDIDIWLVPSEFQDSHSKFQVRRTLEYVDAHWERTGLCWLHCNFTEKSGVPVEVHFRPPFFSRPWSNRKLQRHFASIEDCRCREMVDGVEIPCMKVEEDVVYQMNHIYRHLIDEGVGLRQIVDYYWPLRKFYETRMGMNDHEYSINQTIEDLGMKRFAGALMYVLHELLGMPEEYLICKPVEKDGRFLMEEILMAGNFGQGDPRMVTINAGSYIGSRISQATRRFKRNLRFLASHPGEVIWEPVVRVEHFAWKKLGLWR